MLNKFDKYYYSIISEGMEDLYNKFKAKLSKRDILDVLKKIKTELKSRNYKIKRSDYSFVNFSTKEVGIEKDEYFYKRTFMDIMVNSSTAIKSSPTSRLITALFSLLHEYGHILQNEDDNIGFLVSKLTFSKSEFNRPVKLFTELDAWYKVKDLVPKLLYNDFVLYAKTNYDTYKHNSTNDELKEFNRIIKDLSFEKDSYAFNYFNNNFIKTMLGSDGYEMLTWAKY